MTDVVTLKEARKSSGLTIEGLVQQSGVCRTTIDRIESGSSKYSVNAVTATRLAHAVGYDVKDIGWPHGVSNRGRPPGTGKPIVRAQNTDKPKAFCSEHFIELLGNNECGTANYIPPKESISLEVLR